jgi:pyruvate kinase
MVARGDLGVEIPVEKIPVLQKEMIKSAVGAGKIVLTATQMLDSMRVNPRPTRAEVTDVANAIYDGTSALMLSGETSIGKYPVETVKTMVRIAETAEASIDYWKVFHEMDPQQTATITRAVSRAACATAMDLDVAAIVAVTTGGGTATSISAFRPQTGIIAVTPDRRVMRQLRMSWGVYPYLADKVANTDELFNQAIYVAKVSGLVNDGGLIVVTGGVPVGTKGTTNMMKVQLVGDVLAKGIGLGGGQATGSVCMLTVGLKAEDISPGAILLAKELTEKTLPLVKFGAGLIIEGEDKNGSARNLALALGMPTIIEASGAMNRLTPGSIIDMDGESGFIRRADLLVK